MELTSPKTIKEIAAKFGFTFSKGLGQNFLTDSNVLGMIADAAQPCECALEIGPGFGVLTDTLCRNFEKVVAVEIDQRLMPVLDYTLGEYDNLKIINTDIMKADVPQLIADEFNGKKLSVAANLPYYITTPIITMLLESRLDIENIVVMVQKEVADRICAKAGSKDYGAITLLCQYFTQPSIVVKVPAGSFMPPPKVDSAVLKLHVLDKPSVEVMDEKTLFKVIKASFAQRRKTLLNGISSGLSIPKDTASELIISAGIQPSIRGEKLTLEEFAALADKIYEHNMKGI